MTAIAGGTATPNQRNMLVTDQYQEIYADLVIGDGVSTYPAGGIPLTAAQFGFRNLLHDLRFVDAGSANGYIYKFDHTNKKIRIYQGAYLSSSAADGPLVELTTAATPAAVTLYVMAKGR